MTRQQIPNVSASDVDRIIHRDFPNQKEAIQRELAELSHANPRIQLAILKLSCGNLQQVKPLVLSANEDYRDTIAAAEYPGYMDNATPTGNLTASQREQIIRNDWLQYQDWLNR